ncbi:hypothetical protein B9G55_03765 [Saccharibacillus sp. O16]|nr:hypothetical protein B9G55_03765 [Saccharibacillus sp. O16]
MSSIREWASNGTVPLLEDHRLEHWLASARFAQEGRPSLSAKPGEYHWTQRVQYAVGHAVNRYYSVAPELRKHANAGELVDYRWPRRIAYFDSEASYWQLKDMTARHLHTFFTTNGYSGERPVLLYERLETEVPELGMNLSMIFQLAWQDRHGEGLHLQKFIVDHDPKVLEGYRHAARVFSQHAFGTEPGRIEVYNVLTGERTELPVDEGSYEESLDYLRLAYSGMEEALTEVTCTCEQCRDVQETSIPSSLLQLPQ